MTVVAIHQPQYLPYLGLFHKIFQADVFVALDDAQFQKNGLQNRNKIKNHKGWQWLTVPVQHSHGQRINQVKMDSRVAWPRKHWQALVSCYSRAPYFAELSSSLRQILEQDFAGLSALNMALMSWAMDVLGIRRPVTYASQLAVEGEASERLINICRALDADTYLSGPGGRRYMDLEAFATAGITVLWQEYEPPVYEQRFPEVDFIPNLSIVDVLFNCGPAAAEFLR